MNHVPKNKTREPYIYKQGNKYLIYKKIRSEGNVYFGTFPDLQSAKKYRDFLVEHDWNISYRKRENTKYNLHDGDDHKYITFNKSIGKWVVQYSRDGRHYYFGCFDSFEEAREERDFWKSINWDIYLLDLY